MSEQKLDSINKQLRLLKECIKAINPATTTAPPTYTTTVSYISTAGLQTLPANTVGYEITNLGDGLDPPSFPSATWQCLGVTHISAAVRSFSDEIPDGSYVPQITFNGLGNNIMLKIKTRN